MSNQTTLTDQALWIHLVSIPDLLPMKTYPEWGTLRTAEIVLSQRILAADILLAAFKQRRAEGFDISAVDLEAATRIVFSGGYLNSSGLIAAVQERAEKDFAITPDAERVLKTMGWFPVSPSTTENK